MANARSALGRVLLQNSGLDMQDGVTCFKHGRAGSKSFGPPIIVQVGSMILSDRSSVQPKIIRLVFNDSLPD